jgi:hypothetical protein
MRAKRPAEALEEARLAARRDPRRFLLPVLETLAHTALGRIDAARATLALAWRLRPELTLRHVEISHGRKAAKVLSDIWAPNALTCVLNLLYRGSSKQTVFAVQVHQSRRCCCDQLYCSYVTGTNKRTNYRPP